MERAQLLTQARKEGSLTGTQSFSKFSLNSLSNDTVINRAARLGVSLGVSPEQISNSINIIKEKDNMRTVVMLAKNLKEKSAEEDQHSILNQATNLSVDLVGEEQLGSEEHSAFFVKPKITKVYKRKQKVVPIAVRRSARLSKK
jgi:hydrogenase maturation factor HypE